eukprot:TRINITY_DN12983_c0_g1_i1.p2 TRINITY_DN12983_c0_g1~~TRINITY_DN12983_c0_g1_i1.p2  ORF type:complete len:347 (+),score=51.67 TRINITY_DN12983_c0_g1_i1:1276-2316(+)
MPLLLAPHLRQADITPCWVKSRRSQVTDAIITENYYRAERDKRLHAASAAVRAAHIREQEQLLAEEEQCREQVLWLERKRFDLFCSVETTARATATGHVLARKARDSTVRKKVAAAKLHRLAIDLKELPLDETVLRGALRDAELDAITDLLCEENAARIAVQRVVLDNRFLAWKQDRRRLRRWTLLRKDEAYCDAMICAQQFNRNRIAEEEHASRVALLYPKALPFEEYEHAIIIIRSDEMTERYNLEHDETNDRVLLLAALNAPPPPPPAWQTHEGPWRLSLPRSAFMDEERVPPVESVEATVVRRHGRPESAAVRLPKRPLSAPLPKLLDRPSRLLSDSCSDDF